MILRLWGTSTVSGGATTDDFGAAVRLMLRSLRETSRPLLLAPTEPFGRSAKGANGTMRSPRTTLGGAVELLINAESAVLMLATEVGVAFMTQPAGASV